MPANNVFRWGLIGYGDLAEKRGAAALKEANRSCLNAVWGRDLKKTELFASRHAIPNACPSFDALLDEEIDGVYICTPPDTHTEFTLKALVRGKHVLVEKPMATSVSEAKAMVAASKAADRLLGVAYYRRAFPKMLYIKELIQGGTLGEPVWINIAAHSWFAPDENDPKRWRIDPLRGGGAGALADIGVHRLDLLDDWFGDLTIEHAAFTHLVHSYPVEDSSTLLLRLSNQAPVHAFFSWNTHVWMDRFELLGSEGKIIAEPLDGPDLTIIRGRDREILKIEPPVNAHLPCVENFVDAAFNKSRLFCDADAGLRGARLLSKTIQASLKN